MTTPTIITIDGSSSERIISFVCLQQDIVCYTISAGVGATPELNLHERILFLSIACLLFSPTLVVGVVLLEKYMKSKY